MHLDLATILILHPLSLVVGSGCFLYLRWYSRRSRGLGNMAIGFLVLAGGSVLAGAGAQGQANFATWTFLSFVSGPLSYALFWLGLVTLVTEQSARRGWWMLLLPLALSLLALATGFHLNNLIRSSVFLTVMAGFALASAWLVVRDPQEERLQSRYGLASALVSKAVIAVVTMVSIALPGAMDFGPAETFVVLIICQFAIAMFVVILVLERAEKRLIALTETDSLTGIRNRHWMMDRLPRQVSAASAYVIIDIDHFKQVNDRYGHAAGDHVLTAVAQAMSRVLGESAIFARMGGEEFGLFLPRVQEAEAHASGELLRQTVETLAIIHDGVAIPVTLSAGVAVARGGMSLMLLIGQADEALYVAKRAGRNRVCSFGDGAEDEDEGGASGRRQAVLLL